MYGTQRRDLEGWEEIIFIRNKRLPIWIDGKRPLTTIEQTMSNWLIGGSKTGQQIAMDTFYYFADYLDSYEEKEIEEIKEYRKRKKEEEGRITVTETRKEDLLVDIEPNLASRIIASMTLGNANSSIKNILQNIIASLVKNKMTSKENLAIIKDKLLRNESSELKAIGRYVGRFGSIYSNYKIIRLVVIVLMVIVVFIVLGRI